MKSVFVINVILQHFHTEESDVPDNTTISKCKSLTTSVKPQAPLSLPPMAMSPSNTVPCHSSWTSECAYRTPNGRFSMNSDDIINSLHAADQNEPTESSPKVHLAILRCVLQRKTVVEQIKDKNSLEAQLAVLSSSGVVDDNSNHCQSITEMLPLKNKEEYTAFKERVQQSSAFKSRVVRSCLNVT